MSCAAGIGPARPRGPAAASRAAAGGGRCRPASLLVEPIAKKARFLRTVIEASRPGWRVDGVAATAPRRWRRPRAREVVAGRDGRAVAALAELVELAFPLLEPGGILVAWKRATSTCELAAARGRSRRSGGGIEPSRCPRPGLAGHRLVVVRPAGRAGRLPARSTAAGAAASRGEPRRVGH